MFRPKYQMIKNNQDTASLRKVVVPPGIHAFPQIPKTLIFLEDVEAGIRLGNELQHRLMELTRMHRLPLSTTTRRWMQNQNRSSLTQRFRRAGRDPGLEAVGIVFASRNVLSSTGRWNEDLGKWKDIWDDPAASVI